MESTSMRPPTIPAKRVQPERGEGARTAPTSIAVPTIASAATAAWMIQGRSTATDS